MEDQIRQVLSELEAWGQQNDAEQTDRQKKMLNLEPDTAQLMSILARNGRCTRLLEVGTSNGYSTIWLAWCAQQTDGHLVSIEKNPEKFALAEANLERTGLRELVTLHEGDATEVLDGLTTPLDFVFLDADRWSYPEVFALILPRLVPGALVLADNVHSHPDEIADYLKLISSLDGFDHSVVAVGKGLSIAYKRA